MPYRFVEDVSIADVAFEATGKDLAELLASAAEATTATMVKDLASVRPTEAHAIAMEDEDPEMLLHRFLGEVVYHKDAHYRLLARFDVQVREEPGKGHVVEAVAHGEPLDPARHEQVVDVKAVTWHRFEVEAPNPGEGRAGWRAFVVLDI